MKQFLFLSVLMLLIMKAFAVSNTQASNSSQPIVLLGEINDQSPGAESYKPQLPPNLKVIQEQSAISATYNQKQEEIAEEEDYFDDMDFGMFDEPFGDYDDMYGGPGIMIPISYNHNSNDNNASPPPKMIGYYESQLPNGDILFKQ